LTDSDDLNETVLFQSKNRLLKDYSLLSDIYEDIPKSPLIPCNVYGYGDSSKKIMEILSES
jgi:hypothetical protein